MSAPTASRPLVGHHARHERGVREHDVLFYHALKVSRAVMQLEKGDKVIITGGNGTQTLLPLEPFSEAVSGSAAQTGGGN